VKEQIAVIGMGGVLRRRALLWILACACSLATNAQDPKFEWAKSVGGSSNDAAWYIASDALGNLYITGNYQGIVDFDPGLGTYDLNSSGNLSIYIQKLDSSGNFVWAKSLAGSSGSGRSVTIDGSGNVYITGEFSGTVDFDPGLGIFNLTSNGSSDIFIQKLDSAGNFIWARSIGGISADIGYCVDADLVGNVYITGGYRGTVDFDPGVATFDMTSNGFGEIFIQKLDSGGNFIWAISIGGALDEFGQSITTDAFANVYITGSFKDTVDFDPGTSTYNLISNGGFDVFIQKIDSNGNFIWAQSIGGGITDYGNAITTGPSGDVYITGTYTDTVDFDQSLDTFNLIPNGANDVFILKLDTDGNFIWAKSIGGVSGDVAYSVVNDNMDNVYVAGLYYGSGDFDPGIDTFNLVANAGNEAFIEKLDANGNFVWAQSMGGTLSDVCISITLDPSSNVYAAGRFQGTADLDPSTVTNNFTSNGGIDFFVQKLGQCAPIIGVDVVTECDAYTWIDGTVYTTSDSSATYIFARCL